METTEPRTGLSGEIFADLLEYPGFSQKLDAPWMKDAAMFRLLDLPDTAERCALLVSMDFPAWAPDVIAFAETIATLTPEQREELYTQTFDFNPKRALEAGWHLFGENFKRGTFLVKIRETLREHDLDEGEKLPDHLTHLLRLLDRLDQEEGEAMIAEIILPALRKISESFEGKPNPYGRLIRALVGIFSDSISAEALEISTTVIAKTPSEIAARDAAKQPMTEAVSRDEDNAHEYFASLEYEVRPETESTDV